MDDLSEARIDLDHKAAVWRAARATYDHVRAAGTESAAAVEAAADRLHMTGPLGLSPADAAMDAEVAARESFLAAEREYKRLELAWASTAMTGFQVSWSRARLAGEARRG